MNLKSGTCSRSSQKREITYQPLIAVSSSMPFPPCSLTTVSPLATMILMIVSRTLALKRGQLCHLHLDLRMLHDQQVADKAQL